MEVYTDQLGNQHIKPEDVEAKPRRSLYGSLIEDRILMVRGYWHPDQWEIPGGGAEPGETELEGLSRELTEEIGRKIFALGPLLYQLHRKFYAVDIDTYFNSHCKMYLIREFS